MTSTAAAYSVRLPGDPNQELALRAEIVWTGKTASRALFARELTNRLTRARAQGRAVTTLALPRGAEVEHIDLTIKQGITAVRTHVAEPTGRAARIGSLAGAPDEQASPPFTTDSGMSPSRAALLPSGPGLVRPRRPMFAPNSIGPSTRVAIIIC